MDKRPDYLVIGHISKDLLPDGRAQAGGTVTYSSITAQRLGLQAAIVTALAPKDDPLLSSLREEGIWIHAVPSPQTTTFINAYDGDGRRTQLLTAHTRPITADDIPTEWLSAPIVHLGPVAQELPADMPTLFPNSVLGVTPQGWLRSWDAEGRVSQSALPIPKALRNLPAHAAIILSAEDIGYNLDALQGYVALAEMVVLTQSADDALIFEHGQKIASVPALPAKPIDPTGAGDVFATAFLVRYRETNDPIEAARFAHAAAAFAIESYATKGIADRKRVLARIT